MRSPKDRGAPRATPATPPRLPKSEGGAWPEGESRRQRSALGAISFSSNRRSGRRSSVLRPRASRPAARAAHASSRRRIATPNARAISRNRSPPSPRPLSCQERPPARSTPGIRTLRPQGRLVVAMAQDVRKCHLPRASASRAREGPQPKPSPLSREYISDGTLLQCEDAPAPPRPDHRPCQTVKTPHVWCTAPSVEGIPMTYDCGAVTFTIRLPSVRGQSTSLSSGRGPNLTHDARFLVY